MNNKDIEAFKEAFQPKKRCLVDGPSTKPECVHDIGEPDDCCLAAEGMKKENCPHWRRPDPENALLDCDGIIKWMKDRANEEYDVSYQVKQFVRTVHKGWYETIYSSPVERIARRFFDETKEEYPDEHFELVKVNHREESLDFTVQADAD